MTFTARAVAAAGALAGALLAGCAIVQAPEPATAESAVDACRALENSLAEAVPPGESIAELQARGIQVRTPLSFPPGGAPQPAHAGGAVVEAVIESDGSVRPGSPHALRSIGDPQIATSVVAATLSMSFHFDGAPPPAPVAFATIYAVCEPT